MDQPTDPVAPSEPLRLFLADRDAACPGCGYNLRGIQEAKCPECGRGVELAIARPGRGRGYLLFVLLALGWVLIAGSMNSWRTWGAVRREAQPAVQWLTLNRSFVVSVSGTTVTSSSAITTRSGPATVTFSTGGTGNSRIIGPTPAIPAASAPVWGNVSTRTWVSLGWWSGLGLVALTFLALALLRRRSFDRDRLPRVMMIAACTVFAMYAGYHAVNFSRELF